jgi:hypothetical protein
MQLSGIVMQLSAFLCNFQRCYATFQPRRAPFLFLDSLDSLDSESERGLTDKLSIERVGRQFGSVRISLVSLLPLTAGMLLMCAGQIGASRS